MTHELTRSSISRLFKNYACFFDNGIYEFVYLCRSGTGRTAMFIAMDALYNQGLADGMINVPEFVSAMRIDRKNMIENLVSRQLTPKQ